MSAKKVFDFTAAEIQAAENFNKEIKGDDFFRPEKVSQLIQIFTYEGFDPLITLACLMKIANNASRTLSDDLLVMVILFCERGSNIARLSNPSMARMSEEGQKAANDLMTTYGIVSSGRRQPKQVLTLPRIAAAVPFLTCYYAAKFRNNHPVNAQVPRCMEVSAFGSLIPRERPAEMSERVYEYIKYCHMYAMKELTKVLDKKKKDGAQLEQEVHQYVSAAIRGPIYTDEERLEKLNILGLISKKNKFKGELKEVFLKQFPGETEHCTTGKTAAQAKAMKELEEMRAKEAELAAQKLAEESAKKDRHSKPSTSKEEH